MEEGKGGENGWMGRTYFVPGRNPGTAAPNMLVGLYE